MAAGRVRQLAAGIVAGLVVGITIALLAWARPGFLERGEYWTYDLRARSAASDKPADDIGIVDISDGDMVDAERNWGVSWPWPRAIFGYLASYIASSGAKAVVFDWVFQDRGQYSVDDAEEFAVALRQAGNAVVGLAFRRDPLSEPLQSGAWGFRLGVYQTKDDAERAALRLLAWDVQSFIVENKSENTSKKKGSFQLLIGGYHSRDAAMATWERILAAGELNDILAKAFPAAPHQNEVADDREWPVPRPVELTTTERSNRFRMSAVIAARDSFAPDGFEAVFPRFRGLHEPLAVIGAAPKRMGGVSQLRDSDGVLRRHLPLLEHAGRLYPSLALAALLVGGGEPSLSASPHSLKVGDVEIPLDDHGQFVIRFERLDRYRRVNAYDVLRSTVQVDEGKPPAVAAEVFAGKYVIIAAAGVALRDNHASPVAAGHPGAEIQANALENLLAGVAIQRVSRWVDGFVVFIGSLLVAIVVILVWLSIRKTWIALGATITMTLGLGACYWFATGWLYDAHNIWLGALAPLLGIVLSAFVAMMAASASERRSKRFVQEALGRYTSPALVRELTEHPEHLSLEWGELRDMSVYFSDIAGFTTISEGLEPKTLVALLNEYLTSMTDIILEHGGVVDKYIGDAIMAFWGAPLTDDDHAANGVRCALAMRKACDRLRPQWKERFGEEIYARAGLSSGSAVVGNMGSSHKFNYTVMGDMVNLAARLEGANKPYGTYLMISETTLSKLGDEFICRELDLLAVKGKNKPVRVFEVIDRADEIDQRTSELVERFGKALAIYREHEFSTALIEFNRVLEFDPGDGPAALYVDRCKHFIAEPPNSDWDGVWRMTTK